MKTIGKWNAPTETQKEITKHKRTISRLRSEVKRLKSENQSLVEVCLIAEWLMRELDGGIYHKNIEGAMVMLSRKLKENL